MAKQRLFLWLRRLHQPPGYQGAWSSGLCNYLVTGTGFALALFWSFSRRQEPSLEERIKEQMHTAFGLIKDQKLAEADAQLHALLLTVDEATRAGAQTNEQWLQRRARVYSELANLKLMQKEYAAAERLFVHTIRDCTASGVPPGSPMIIELSL
ncbi:unnamed protein product, partial [Dibothriocephalus latus]